MTIGKVDSAPLPAVHAVTEPGAREETAAPRAHRATPPDAQPSDATPPANEPIKLPEFTQYELSFRVDRERRRVVVQVIDAKTGTVVRTVPPDELGRLVRRLPNPRGLILDRET